MLGETLQLNGESFLLSYLSIQSRLLKIRIITINFVQTMCLLQCRVELSRNYFTCFQSFSFHSFQVYCTSKFSLNLIASFFTSF